MTFAAATPAQVSDILSYFDNLTWPVPEAVIPDVIAGLGWHVSRVNPGLLVVATTSLPVNRPDAMLSSDDGELTEVRIFLTDVVPEGSATNSVPLRDAFTGYFQAVSGLFGKPITRSGGKTPSAIWDTASSGRARLSMNSQAVLSGFISPEFAGVQRESDRLAE